MLQQMRRTIGFFNMLSQGDQVVVGLSGGADSVALLHGLCECRKEFDLTLTAAHVNHQLRGDAAEADADFAAKLCERLGVPFLLYAADVRGHAQQNGLSLEEAGRQLRYALLEQAQQACNAQKIALAHNRDDNAETILMHLCRGSGLKGLGGIPPVRGSVIRPLIETSRQNIEGYLQEKGAAFRTDASNFDDHFTRNRIRHEIMPLLAERVNKNAAALMTQNAALLRADDAFLESLAAPIFEACVQKDAEKLRFNIEILLKTPSPLRRRVLRMGLEELEGLRDVGAAHVAQMENLLTSHTGKATKLPHGLQARRDYDELTLFRENEKAVQNEFSEILTLDKPVYVPLLEKWLLLTRQPPAFAGKEACTNIFNYDRINALLQIRTRRPGDRIYLEGVGTRKLQDYFTDVKLPRELRDHIPLLADGMQILWIMDSHNRLNGAYKPKPGCEKLWVSVYGKEDDRLSP